MLHSKALDDNDPAESPYIAVTGDWSVVAPSVTPATRPTVAQELPPTPRPERRRMVGPTRCSSRFFSTNGLLSVRALDAPTSIRQSAVSRVLSGRMIWPTVWGFPSLNVIGIGAALPAYRKLRG